MKHFIAIAVLLSSASCTFAQTEGRRASLVGRFGHYVATHKELLVSDLVVFGAWNANAAASRHVANVGYLGGSGDFWGADGTFKTYGEANLFAGGFVAIDHLLWRYVRTDANGEKTWDRHAVLVAAGFWSATAFAGVKGDYDQITYCKTTGSCLSSDVERPAGGHARANTISARRTTP
jgi:hypothetical protein